MADYSLPISSSDTAGRVAINTIFGDIQTVVREPDATLRWPYNINTVDNVTTTTGSGTVTAVGDMATISTGVTEGSVARLNSVNLVRYRPGSEIFCFFTTIFTCSGSPGSQQGIDGSTQAVGIFDSTDGFAIGFNGIQFGIRWRVSGVDTWIPQSQFNRDQLANVDLTKIQLWRISFGWFGGAPIFFEYINDDAWTPFHIIPVANVISNVSVHNPSYPVTIEAISSTSTTNITVKVGCMEGGSSRPIDTRGIGYRYFHYSSAGAGIALKTISTTTIPILSISNPSTYQSVTNKTMIALYVLIATNATSGTIIQYNAVIDAALTGASFSSLDSVNSVAQVDTSATAVSGGSKSKYGISVGLGTTPVDLNGSEVRLFPGHILTITAIASASSSGIIDLNWREEY